jgi:Polyketide cyclase / dehydrase and lipid transport
MGRWRVEASGFTSAAPHSVWPLIGEAERWAEWAGFTRATLERPGTGDPQGVGALRHFSIGPGGSREEVVAWEPPHHLAYTIVSGFPVREYRADVHLEAEGGGTRVRWEATFDERFPGTGAVMRVVVDRLIHRFVHRLVRHSARLGEG